MSLDWETIGNIATGGAISAVVTLVCNWVQDRRRRKETIADRRAAVAGHALGLIAEFDAACRHGNGNAVFACIVDHGSALDTAVEAFTAVLDATDAASVRGLSQSLTDPHQYDGNNLAPQLVAERAAALRTALLRLAPGAVPIITGNSAIATLD